ncbi:GNAT family N-acetyltransferase [Streptomyces fuscigenes]|uniref:GNAT family N-acetyltransferase n=1 Tax=Streptomyces fuscigenes TaxID=1528880 RepID=UPI001F37ADD5|nr:GNAT family N-acetyltransferase [Streptomyces fuscigenes]MCF3961298.1 GNAT family N-acetyltransferase [Streptomyces fuscigenes]
MDEPSASAGYRARPVLPRGGVLRTARLVLRPARARDVDAYTRLWTDREVRRFLGGPVDGERLRLRQQRFDSRPRVFSVTALPSDEVLGTVSVDVADRPDGRWELAYSFLPEHWGRGYGREAVAAVLTWVLDTVPLGDASVIAVTEEANVRSRRLLEAVGMGARERFVEFGRPQVLYGIERGERQGAGGAPDAG